MVSSIHINIDDDEKDRLQTMKDDLGLTWREFLVEGADALEQRRSDE